MKHINVIFTANKLAIFSSCSQTAIASEQILAFVDAVKKGSRFRQAVNVVISDQPQKTEALSDQPPKIVDQP